MPVRGSAASYQKKKYEAYIYCTGILLEVDIDISYVFCYNNIIVRTVWSLYGRLHVGDHAGGTDLIGGVSGMAPGDIHYDY